MKKRRQVFFAFVLLLLATAFLGHLTQPAICYEFSMKKPAIGAKKVAVVAVQFSDKSASSTIDYLRQRIFVEMNAYFQNVSYGKMSIIGDIVDEWVLLPQNMSYYGYYNGTNNHSEGARALIKDSLKRSSGCVNFSQFDSVFVIHAGEDEATSGNLTDIWSVGFGAGLRASTEEGYIFNGGAVLSETSELGVFCHEFGHILRLPDLYNYDRNSSKGFVGQWDIMDVGDYVGNPPGANPGNLLSWSKIFLGWIDDTQVATVRLGTSLNMTTEPLETTPERTNYRQVAEIKLGESSDLTIEPLETNSEGFKAINISIASMLYYLIEARIDNNLQDQGILLTFINETRRSGEGIVEVIDSKNSTSTLDDATFHVGDRFEDTQHMFTVEVLKSDNSSFTVQISNKVVPQINVLMPIAVEVYQEARIEAQVVSSNATPLRGLATTLFVDGERYQTGITDANGTVVYVLSFDLFSIGKKSLTLEVACGEFNLDNQVNYTLGVTAPWWFVLAIIAAIAVLMCIQIAIRKRQNLIISH